MTQKTPQSIIDPPVGPYSLIEELVDWIAELEGMPSTPEVRQALEQANDWLKRRRDIGD